MRKRLTNRALNKVFKSTKTSLRVPKYKMNKNSSIRIELPNGINLRLYANREGDYCSVEVKNTNTENYKIETEREKKELIHYKTDDVLTDYYANNELKLSFNLCKWNEI